LVHGIVVQRGYGHITASFYNSNDQTERHHFDEETVELAAGLDMEDTRHKRIGAGAMVQASSYKDSCVAICSVLRALSKRHGEHEGWA